MKFNVDAIDFQKALAKVDGIIPSREVKSIISNVLLSANSEGIRMTATDLEMIVSTNLSANIGEPGTVAVPARKLAQTVAEFRGSNLSFTLSKNNMIKIGEAAPGSKAWVQLMGAPADDYPSLPDFGKERFIDFPIAILSQMIHRTNHAIAEDDSRYVFNGLFISATGKDVTIVGTDGRRLAKMTKGFPNELPLKEGIILPGKSVRQLSRILDQAETGRLAYQESEKRVFFSVGDVILICKLIEGRFPDYDKVIPRKLDHELKLNRTAFERSLRKAAITAAEPTKQVKLTFAPGTLTIAASTPDIGDSGDVLQTDYNAEEMTIGFNSNYITDILKVIPSEDIVFSFSTPTSPAIISDPAEPDFTAVIQPMRV